MAYIYPVRDALVDGSEASGHQPVDANDLRSRKP